MKDKLSPAVDALLEKLTEQQRAVSETKRMINALRGMIGEEPLFADVQPENVLAGPTRRDQYYGKGLATAAEEYLKRRSQACDAEEIQRGLAAGGFDFAATGWKEKDWLRMLAISLAKNTQKFHKLPNNTFGLLEWYPAVANRRSEKAEKLTGGESLPSAAMAATDAEVKGGDE
jgi:hypothetical protein